MTLVILKTVRHARVHDDPGLAERRTPAREAARERRRGIVGRGTARDLLRTGTAGRSAVDLAREILGSFCSLRKLIAADRARFCAHPGLGPARYAELQAAAEISRRQLAES